MKYDEYEGGRLPGRYVRRRRPRITEILAVYQQANGICALCGEPVLPQEITIDHIVPLSKGGADDLSNFQIAHRSCNSAKNAKSMEEFKRTPKKPKLIKAKRIRDSQPSQEGMQTIRALRKARNWTQLYLANQLGVTPATIYNWEAGKTEPSASQLRRIAQAFDVSMDEIELVERESKIAA